PLLHPSRSPPLFPYTTLFRPLLPLTRELMDSWKPDDRAAVVSHDSHFKLWLDFSHDREAIYRAISRAIRAGGEPGAVRPNRTGPDRKSTRLNSSHVKISYAVF